MNTISPHKAPTDVGLGLRALSANAASLQVFELGHSAHALDSPYEEQRPDTYTTVQA